MKVFSTPSGLPGLVLTFFLFLAGLHQSSAQVPALGDYQSTGDANWGLLTTWQRWDGVSWLTPTAMQGYPGELSTPNRVTILNGHDVVLDVNPANAIGSLTIQTGTLSSSLTFSGINSLTVTGAITINAGTSGGITKTLNVAGGSLTCGSISMANTGGNTRVSSLTISTGTVIVTGNLTMNSSNINRNMVSLTSAGTLIVGGALTGGNLTTVPGSTVEYNGGAQVVRGVTYSGNLILSGSGAKTFQAGFGGVNGDMTVTGTASVTTSSSTVVGGILTMESGTTINFNATNHFIGSDWINNGATINWNGSTISLSGTDQTIGGLAPTTFYNLSFVGGGTKTFAWPTAISGVFSISSGTIADLGTLVHTANSLLLNSIAQGSGTWGSSSSLPPVPPVDHIDDFYFAATSGYFSVTSATYFSIADGPWDDENTWSLVSGGVAVDPGIFPTANDNVIIENGNDVFLDAPATCASVSFTSSTGTSLSLAGFQLDVANAITILNTGTGINLVDVGTSVLNAASVSFTGGSATSGHQITISTGQLNVSGDIITDNSGVSATITLTDAGTIDVGLGLMTTGVVGGTVTTFAGSSIVYGAGNQAIRPGVYLGDLTLTGNGTKTAIGALSVAEDLNLESTITFTAGAFTHSIQGNWENNGAVFNSTGSTITLDGDNQGINGVSTTFNNLILGGTGTKTLSQPTIVNGNLSITAVADLGVFTTHTAASLTLAGVGQNSGTYGGASSGANNVSAFFDGVSTGQLTVLPSTFYSIASTDWDTSTTWSFTSGGPTAVPAGRYPVAGDNVVIERGFNVILDASAACATLSYSTIAATSLSLNGNQLNVSGAVTIPRPGSGVNLLNVGSGVLNAGSVIYTTGVGGGSGQRHQISISTGTMTVTGDITTYSANISATITFTGNGTLNAHQGIFTTGFNGGTLTTIAGSTVNYAGASQTVKDISYLGNLSISGSGTKTWTMASNRTIAGDLLVTAGELATVGNRTLGVTGATSVTGTLSLGGTAAKTFTGDVTLNMNGIWNEVGVAPVIFGGNLVNNATTFTANTGVHTFSGTAKALSGSTPTVIATASFSGSYTNDGTLTVNASLSGAGSITQGATGILNVGGTLTLTTLDATTNSGNAVNYVGAAQTVRPIAYSTLGLSGSGIKTMTGVTSIGGDFNMTGTAIATAPASMTIGGSVNLDAGTTFTAGAFTHLVTGDWTNNGATFINTGSTINLNGTGQTINGTAPVSFYNLILSGLGTTSLAAEVAVSNNLRLIGTSQADLDVIATHNAYTLTFDTDNQLAGTWGSTASLLPLPAEHQDDAHFANTGQITVATATFYSVASGDWDNTLGTTWSLASGGTPLAAGIYPQAGDQVVIEGGFNVTLSSTTECENLSFATGMGSTVTMGMQQLDVSGTITIPGATTPSINTLAVDDGLLNVPNISFTNGSYLAIHQITINTGIVTVTGDITTTSPSKSAAIVFTGGGTLNVEESIFTTGMVGGTLTTAIGSTVNYIGTGTVIKDANYYNLNISGSGTKTWSIAGVPNRVVAGYLSVGAGLTLNVVASQALTVSGITSVGGTFNLSGSSTKTFTGDVTIDATGMWTEGVGQLVNFGGSLTNNGSYTANSSVHTFTGASEILDGTLNIPSVVVSGTYTNTATLTCGTSLQITGTVVNDDTITASSALSGAGTLTQGSTGLLTLGGTITITNLDASINGGNTVSYTGDAQVVKPVAYSNLILNGNGVKTITDLTTVAEDFSLNGSITVTAEDDLFISQDIILGAGVTFDAGGNFITVSGNWTNNGATFLNTGSTVDFNGASQTIGGTSATNFYNLRFYNSGTKTITWPVAIAGNLYIIGATQVDWGTHQTHTANSLTLGGINRAAGTWGSSSSAATNVNDTYFAATTGYITIGETLPTTYYSIADGNWSDNTTWSLSSGGDPVAIDTYPVAGDIVTIENGNDVTITGVEACASLTFTNVAATSLLFIGGQLDVSGAVTIPRAPGAPNLIDVADGTLNAASIAFTEGGDNTGQYHQLAINNGSVNITGDVTQSGSTGSASILFTGTGTLTLGGAFLGAATATFTAGSGTVEYNGAAQTVGDFTYHHLTLSGSGTKTMTGVSTINGDLTLEGTASATATTNLTIVGDITLESGTAFTAGAFAHNIAGDWINNGTTFTNTGSTINFNGAAQSISGSSSTTFNNVILATSGIKSLSTIDVDIDGSLSITGTALADLGSLTGHTANTLALGGANQFAGIWGGTAAGLPTSFTNDTYFQSTSSGSITVSSQSAFTFYSIASGNWNDNNTWSTTSGGSAVPAGVYPLVNDAVFVEGGFVVTANVNAFCSSLTVGSTIAGTTILVDNGITLTVTNALTALKSVSTNTTCAIAGNGTLNAGSMIIGSTTNPTADATIIVTSTISALNVSGTLTLTSRRTGSNENNPTLRIESGTVALLGTLTCVTSNNSASTTLVTLQTGGQTGTLALASSTPISTSGNSGISTFNFNGSTATVNYNGSTQTVRNTTYRNLSLSGTGTKTMTGITTINGDFTLSGTASATAAAGLTIGGNVTLGSGTTFAGGAFTHNVAGNWINNGATFTNNGSTINFNGTTQSIGGSQATTFNNLSFSSGTTSLGLATSASGIWTINGGQVDPGILAHEAGLLVLTATAQPSGFYGSTSSPAPVANQSDVYFLAGTTGYINAHAHYYSVADGNWNSNSTWAYTSNGTAIVTAGVYPVAGDAVTIERGFDVTLTAGAACSNITFNTTTATVLALAGNQLDVSGAITLARHGAGTNLIDVGAGTLNAGSISFTNTSAGTGHQITISSGTLSVGGDITANAAGVSATIAFTGAGTLNAGVGILTTSPATGTLTTFAGSTINYYGTVAQTVRDQAYAGNLTISGSNTKSWTFTGNRTVGGNLTVGTGATLAISSAASTLGVTGTTDVTGTLTLAGSGTKTLAGNVTLFAGGTFTQNVGAVSMGGNLSVAGTATYSTTGNHTLGVAGATNISGTINLGGSQPKTFTGDVTLQSGSIWNHTGGTIGMAGNFTNNSSTFTAGSSTYTFSGASKLISGSTPTSLSLTTISGSYTNNGTISSSGQLSVTGTLLNNGTVTASTTLTGGAGTFTQGATGVLNFAGTSIGVNTFNASTASNVVNYIGADQTVRQVAYSTLELSGSGTKTLTNITTIGADFNMGGSAIATNTSALAVGGDINLSGTASLTSGSAITLTGSITLESGTSLVAGTHTHSIEGDWINNGCSFNSTGSTINFNGNLQNIGGTSSTTFYNAILGGTGMKNFSVDTYFLRNLAIVTSVDFNGLTSHTANTLTLAGQGQAPGTYGATGSGAGNENDTYFPGAGFITVNARGYYSIASGNWNDNATWSYSSGGVAVGAGVFPVAGDYVTIEGNRTVTVNVNSACADIEFQSLGNTNTIDISSTNQLDVSGTITLPRANTSQQNRIRVQDGTLNVGNIAFTDGGASSTRHNISINNGTVTVSGDVTQQGSTGSARFTFTGAGLLQLGGTFLSSATGVLTQGTGTVEYNGTAQTVGNFTYNNLTLSGSGAKTMTGVTTVGGDFNMAGTATASAPLTSVGGDVNLSGSSALSTSAGLVITGDVSLAGTSSLTTGSNISITGNLSVGDGTTLTVGAYDLTVNGTTTVGDGASGSLQLASATGIKTFVNSVTVAVNGTWNNSANSAVTFRGGIINSGTFTAGSGVHTFETNPQALTGFFEIPSVTVTGIALTNNNDLTVSTDLTGSGELVQAATANLYIGGTSGITLLTATASDNTVEYYGDVQAVHGGNYFNLTLSGSGNKTLQASTTTIGGTLSLSGTAYSTTAAGLDIEGDLDIAPGSILTNGGHNISIAGNWNNYGAYTASTETVTFDGIVDQNVEGVNTFFNMTTFNSGGAIVLPAETTIVNGLLTLTNGNLHWNFQLILNGTFANASGMAGPFLNATSADARLTIGSTVAVGDLYFSPSGNTINTLTIDGTGGTTDLGNALTVSDSLHLTDGTLDNFVATLTLGDDAMITRTNDGHLTAAPLGNRFDLTYVDGSAANLPTEVEFVSGRVNNIAVNVTGTVTQTTPLSLQGLMSFGSSASYNAGMNQLTVNSSSDVTDLSDPADTNGSIGEIAAGESLTGEVIVERYMSAKGTINRYISSSVTGETLADLLANSAPNTTFSIVRNLGQRYNEPTTGSQNNGYQNVGTTSVLQSGRGYLIMPSATYSGSPITWDVAGPLTPGSNQGDVNLNILYTNTGAPTADGWNLVGNPYPSAIQWTGDGSDWTSTNVDPVVYVPDVATGNYHNWDYSLNSGAGGGTLPGGMIAMGQAFWVKANAGASLVVHEGAKTTSSSTFYRVGSNPGDGLSVTLSSPTSHDISWLLINPDATVGYEQQYDRYKLEGDVLAVSFDVDDRKLLYSALDEIGENIVPLTVKVTSDGEFNFAFAQLGGMAEFENLYLVDKQLGNVHKISSGTYSFYSTARNTTDRFFLTAHPEKVFGSEMILSVFPNPTAKLLTVKVFSKQDPSATIVDMTGATVLEGVLTVTDGFLYSGTFDLSGLANGMYLVRTVVDGRPVVRKVVKH